jgi:hypothetical protein
MSLTKRNVKKYAKARRRRYRTAQERLARDRRQAQRAAEALQQALDDLGLPDAHSTGFSGREVQLGIDILPKSGFAG